MFRLWRRITTIVPWVRLHGSKPATGHINACLKGSENGGVEEGERRGNSKEGDDGRHTGSVQEKL